MRQVVPGVFTAMFGELIAKERIASRLVITQLAAAIEKQAKINVSNGRHARGTPTPAQPGEGPAVITGTLRKSITSESPEATLTGWTTKVGTGIGFTPPRGKTPASKYGKYLETGLKNGAKYPWLLPAAKFVSGGPALLICKSVYGPAFRW